MRRPIRNYLLCFTIRYRRLLPSKKIGTLVGESSSSGSLAMLLANPPRLAQRPLPLTRLAAPCLWENRMGATTGKRCRQAIQGGDRNRLLFWW